MIAHEMQHNGVTFGLRVLVHRVVIRVRADARYDLYEDGRCVRVFKELRDERRQPVSRGQAPRYPTWPG